jgi:hypothetical protein
LGYPRPQSRPRILIILVVFVVVAITAYMFLPRFLVQGKVYDDETQVVERGSFRYASALVDSGWTMDVSVDVRTGGAVDVLLLNSENKIVWDKFIAGQSQGTTYISQGSALNVQLFHYIFIVSQKDTYYVLVNNGGRIAGGATPTGEVSVHFKIVLR